MTILVGCSTGAPTGFSAGDHWTVPLVGPMEDGLLVVPVFVGDKGPYLFSIDPDANVSAVDDKIVKEAHLRSGQGPRLDDELGHQNPHFYAEVLEMHIGKLVVQRKSALIVKTGTYNSDGREIDGVLGRDVIADSLVFGFDRDAGLVTLETQGAWQKNKPAAATAIHYDLLPERQNSQVEVPDEDEESSVVTNDVDVQPISRRTAAATIDGEKFVVHLDFGATSSQLRERSWAKAKLAEGSAQGMLVDETGTGRPVAKLGTAAEVALGGLAVPNVAFVPYVEARWPDEDLEGALGLDFFRPFAAWIDWDKQTVHLVPRHGADLVARAGRWQLKELAACAVPGCVTASVIDPLASKPPDQRPAQHPGVVVTFARDPATGRLPFEALVAARGADGTPLGTLVVSLPAGEPRAMTHLPGAFAGAQLTVIDVDPFPRACPQAGGCVDVLRQL